MFFANMQPLPPDFDWIAARTKCSIGRIFEVLATVGEQDVKRAKAMLAETKRNSVGFHFERQGDIVLVIKERRNVTGSEARTVIRFSLQATEIEVDIKDAAKQQANLFTIKPSLNPEGTRKVVVNGQELDNWQVSRLALEDLFFGD
jgi:hypothetical protein